MMFINGLTSDELDWELLTREIDPVNHNVDQKRKRLRIQLNLERQKPSLISSYKVVVLNVDTELDFCHHKLIQLRAKVHQFANDPVPNECKRLVTKLDHLSRRLNYITNLITENNKERWCLLKEQCIELLVSIDEASENEELPPGESEPISESADTVIPQPITPKGVNKDTEYETMELNNQVKDLHLSKVNNVNALAGFSIRTVSVAKWNVKFSGNTAQQGLNSFLERVEELRIARNMSMEQLFLESIDLFEGQALIWFRSIRNRVRSWEEIVRLLKKHYLPSDYDEALWAEIRTRVQGTTERPHIYIASMINLFNRLTNVPAEEVQLKYIRCNLQPFYSNKLALIQVISIDALIDFCKELEDLRDRNKLFRSNVTTNNSPLEPDLAYQEPVVNKRQVNTISTNNTKSNAYKSRRFLKVNANLTCWNCQDKGHTYHRCMKERTIFCYVCGSRNVFYSNCPRCHPKNELGQVSASANDA